MTHIGCHLVPYQRGCLPPANPSQRNGVPNELSFFAQLIAEHTPSELPPVMRTQPPTSQHYSQCARIIIQHFTENYNTFLEISCQNRCRNYIKTRLNFCAYLPTIFLTGNRILKLGSLNLCAVHIINGNSIAALGSVNGIHITEAFAVTVAVKPI